MKKLILLFFIIFLSKSVLYSRSLNDTSSFEKSGWLVYYLGHRIWFEADLTDKVNDKNFFTAKKKYENGLIIDNIVDAKMFEVIARCYKIKSLTNIDTSTWKGEYTYSENICIIPVKVKGRNNLDLEAFDKSWVPFKRNKHKVRIEFWALTNYSIFEVELLRKSDKLKISRMAAPGQ